MVDFIWIIGSEYGIGNIYILKIVLLVTYQINSDEMQATRPRTAKKKTMF